MYFPKEGIPERLRLLIEALTFSDPGRAYLDLRWTYDEVKRWCDGDPALENPKAQAVNTAMPFRYDFANKTYFSPEDALLAFIQNWMQAEDDIYNRGNMVPAPFENFGYINIARKIRDAQAENDRAKESERVYIQNVRFWEIVYGFNEGIEEFYWAGEVFADFQELTKRLHRWAVGGDLFWTGNLTHMLRGKILSAYLRHVRADGGLIRKAEELESKPDGEPAALTWKLMYAANPGLKSFIWGEHLNESDLPPLVAELTLLFMKDTEWWNTQIANILRGGVLSAWLAGARAGGGPIKSDMIKRVKKIEDRADENLYVSLWKLGYIANPNLADGGFSWRHYHEEGPLSEFASYVSGADKDIAVNWDAELDIMLRGGVLSFYLSEVQPDNGLFRSVDKIENEYNLNVEKYTKYEREAAQWRLIYLLCGDRPAKLRWGGAKYKNLNKLANYLLTDADYKAKHNMLLCGVISTYPTCRRDARMLAAVEKIEAGYKEKIFGYNSKETESYVWFWRMAHTLTDKINGFHWYNERFEDLQQFGAAMKRILGKDEGWETEKRAGRFLWGKDWNGTGVWSGSLHKLAAEGILSEYLSYIKADGAERQAVKALEEKYGRCNTNYEREYTLHEISYEISGSDVFYFAGAQFVSVDALIAYLAEALKEPKDLSGFVYKKNKDRPTPIETFLKLVNKLVDTHSGAPSAHLAAWLARVGSPEQVKLFNKKLASRVKKTK